MYSKGYFSFHPVDNRTNGLQDNRYYRWFNISNIFSLFRISTLFMNMLYVFLTQYLTSMSSSVHEILLRVAQKVSGTRVYLPAREFVWNAASGSGAADLKKAIAVHFDLQSYDVLLAKYNPDTCVWTVLRDSPQVSRSCNLMKL